MGDMSKQPGRPGTIGQIANGEDVLVAVAGEIGVSR